VARAEQLQDTVANQELVLTQLQEQIEELVSGGAEEVAREEARLRTENQKLQYRLNILQQAVARETENTTA